MDAKTVKSELTRTAIVDAAVDLVAEQGLLALTLQAVSDRCGVSKSGVFSRVGSREALQKAVIDEWGQRFAADVFVPAMELPRGLPRLDAIVRRWVERTRVVEAHTGCIYTAGGFELDDREGELRDHLHTAVLQWRSTVRRTILQGIDAGHLRPDLDAEQLVSDINALAVGLLYDVRFLRAPRAAERALNAWARLLRDAQA